MMIAMFPHQVRGQDGTLEPLRVPMLVGAAGPHRGFGVAHLRVILGYSPECEEGAFSELRPVHVLGVSPRKNRNLAHLRDARPLRGEYAAIVTWSTDRRERA